MGLRDWEKLLMRKLEHCTECGGKLEYLGLGKYKCVECGNKMLDDYGKVKEYLWEHGPTPMLTLAKETGVSREKINIVLNGGSSEISDNNVNMFATQKTVEWDRQDNFANMDKKIGSYTRFR